MSPTAWETPATQHPLCPTVEDWIFDLDNTLYPASCSLFPQIDQRMRHFVANYLDLSLDEAHRVQKSYYRDHGTTLNGLMTLHGMEPDAFLDFVHDIDHGVLSPEPRLDEALSLLPGRKFIFTNGTERHAEKVLAALGLEQHFQGIFDIRAASFRPKPDHAPYETLVRRFGLRAERCAMVEDLQRNLLPAHLLGMTTLWVRQDDHPDQAHFPTDAASVEPHVDHMTDDLADWLAGGLKSESS